MGQRNTWGGGAHVCHWQSTGNPGFSACLQCQHAAPSMDRPSPPLPPLSNVHASTPRFSTRRPCTPAARSERVGGCWLSCSSSVANQRSSERVQASMERCSTSDSETSAVACGPWTCNTGPLQHLWRSGCTESGELRAQSLDRRSSGSAHPRRKVAPVARAHRRRPASHHECCLAFKDSRQPCTHLSVQLLGQASISGERGGRRCAGRLPSESAHLPLRVPSAPLLSLRLVSSAAFCAPFSRLYTPPTRLLRSSRPSERPPQRHEARSCCGPPLHPPRRCLGCPPCKQAAAGGERRPAWAMPEP